MTPTIIIGYKYGNAQSGNWGHEGRPGKEGGSLPSGKTHGSIPGSGAERQPLGGGAFRSNQAMAGANTAAPVKSSWEMPVPQLSIPTGTVPEHEEGDADGKADYQKWLQSQAGKKVSLADALAMRKYFADRARTAEAERAQGKAEGRAADLAKRRAEEKNKPKVLTPAQKKKAEAEAKKAASAAASAKKKAESEAKKAQKKAESEANKKKKADEAAAKKAAAANKKPTSTSKKPAGQSAADKKRQAAEAKQEAAAKVAESIGLSGEGLSMFQEAMATLKGGGKPADNVLSALADAGLLVVSGDSVRVPSAARSLLSAILAGDALKAQDAMDKLKKGGKEYVGRVAVRLYGNRVVLE